MTRPIHLAKMTRPDGAVSPLCARVPRRIDLTRASWTLQAKLVTCTKCLQIALEQVAPAKLRAMGN